MTDMSFERLLDWYQDTFTEGYFESCSGGRVRFACQHRESSHGYVVIVPGRTEFIEKYLEVSHDLQQSGYSLCIFDHFGQGASSRPLADHDKGHIDDFQSYVTDLRHLLTSQLRASIERRVVLLTHSMGGTIAALFAAQHPRLLNGLILVSPMLQINTGLLLPPLLVEAVSGIICRLGGKERYVWGGGPFNADLPFEHNELTGDEDRFTRNLWFQTRDREKAIGSPTFGWLLQAYRAMRQVRSREEYLQCPTLILQAADDRVVGLEAMTVLCRANRFCTMVKFDEARHELLMEQNWIRDRVIAEIRSFLTRTVQ